MRTVNDDFVRWCLDKHGIRLEEPIVVNFLHKAFSANLRGVKAATKLYEYFAKEGHEVTIHLREKGVHRITVWSKEEIINILK